jgi:very-short-patch-repair endonuclease
MHRSTPVARKLRREATAAEKRLWRFLKNAQLEGFKFRRQVPLSECIVDFACLEARLIIEIDGATHSSEVDLSRDAEREGRSRSCGFEIMRFQNQDVL